MEENQPKIGKFSLNYGLILGLISVIFSVMLFTMDAHTSRDPSNTVISIVIMAAVTFWGIFSFRKANSGYLSIGQAVKLGAGIALISALVAVVYTIILSNVMDPDFALKIAEVQKAADEAAGQMTAEQIQQRYDGTINFFWITYPFILIFSIIVGLVLGLVGGLIFKKAKPAY